MEEKMCGELHLAGHQMSAKPLYHSSSSTGIYDKRLLGQDKDRQMTHQSLA